MGRIEGSMVRGQDKGAARRTKIAWGGGYRGEGSDTLIILIYHHASE